MRSLLSFSLTDTDESKVVSRPLLKESDQVNVQRGLAALVAALAGLMVLLVSGPLSGRLSASLTMYGVQPLLWAVVSALAFVAWRYGPEARPRLARSLLLTAALTGAAHVSVLVIAGLLVGFGRSPYSHQPGALLGNLLYALSWLCALELTRAALLKAFGQNQVLWAIAGATVLFSLLTLRPAQFTAIGDPGALIRLVGETLLPTLAKNLLASCLALVGGPLASGLYLAVLLAFEWFSPILPDLPWVLTAFIGTLTPALALMALRDQLLPDAPHAHTDARPAASGVSKAWLFVAATAVALAWLNTGAFGVRPTLVVGASMLPTLRAGDVAIVQQVSPDVVNVGDIIRFRSGEGYILHRVTAVQAEGGERRFLTRGDANNADDPWLPASRVEGRLVLAVPKIGWIGLLIRQAAFGSS